MKVLQGILFRELLRSFRSGLWYAAAATFYFAYAIYFDLIFTSAAGPQPQPISPLRSIFSGEMLLLWVLFVPVLAQKSLVEERAHKTWESLVITGIPVWMILLAKFSANFLQLIFWMGICMVFPISLSFFIAVDLAILLSSVSMVVLVAMHWLSFCYFLLCKTKSFVPAYFKAGICLMLYYLFPLLIVLLPDPFYRPIFETMDLGGVLKRASQGIILGHDVIWLLGGMVIFLIATELKLSNEVSIGLTRLKNSIKDSVYLIGCCFVLISCLFVSHSRSWILDVSSSRQGDLSEDYRNYAKEFPDGLEVTVALPENWNAPSYAQARTCLLTFFNRTKALAPSMKIQVLDPDVDYLAMERLEESGGKSDNKVGFVSIALNKKRLNIPYHQWVSLGTLTIDNEPHRYLRAFKGEDQMLRAVNHLTQNREKGQALVFSGHGELDPGEKGLLGGTEFLDLIRQFGLGLIRYKPDLDTIPDLSKVKLIVLLDPQTGMSPAFEHILDLAFEKQIPVLAAKGPALKVLDTEAKSFLKPFGVLNSDGVIYQRHYTQYDPFTLPVAEMSSHPSVNGLQKRVIIFDHVSALREGIPQDPRLKVVPLLRTQDSEKIWDEHQYDPKDPLVQHQFGSRDKASPLFTGMAAEWHNDDGTKPALVVFGTRSIFENRWIHHGANRELLFNGIDWLLHRESQIKLPPSILADYKIEASLRQQYLTQAAVSFIPPIILFLLGFYQWKRRQ